MARKYQDEYNYQGPGGSHYDRDRQDRPAWGRSANEDDSYGRQPNYNRDYNRNYNQDYNQDYNSYHLYHRDHDQEAGRGNSERRQAFGARAQGDYSGGTRYGEGGSTYGGGSSYGRSYYGPSGNHGAGRSESGSYRSVNSQNGYGSFSDYDNRNYGSYGGYQQNNLGRREEAYRSGRNTGYSRGDAEYNPTGYGSTRYNNRDEDRARSAFSSGNERSRGGDDYIRSRYRDDYRREL